MLNFSDYPIQVHDTTTIYSNLSALHVNRYILKSIYVKNTRDLYYMTECYVNNDLCLTADAKITEEKNGEGLVNVRVS